MKEMARGAEERPSPALDAGDMMPNLVFQDERAERFSIHTLRGRPFIVALSSKWNAGGAALVGDDELRAELRGIGASLLVISAEGSVTMGPQAAPNPGPQGAPVTMGPQAAPNPGPQGAIWFLDADDPVKRLSPPGGDEGLSAVYRALGVRRTDRGEHALTLLVVDSKGKIRWVHEEPAGPREAGTVLAALRAAGEALRSRPPNRPILLNRRELVITTLVSAFALLALEDCTTAPDAPAGPKVPAQPPPPGSTVDIKLNVNGQEHALTLEPRVTLLDTLRERLGLTGTKKGCDHGQCGACTVLIDGRRMNACLTLSVMHQNAKITTIEGLARGGDLHPMQAAFVEHDAFQCGYCTPGQIMSAVGLVSEGHAHSDAEIRELMSGNICRCGAYPNIVAAIQEVQRKG